MPHSQYVAGKEPPSWGDRYLSYAYSLPLGVIAFIVGALILLSVFADLMVSRSLNEAPTWLTTGIGLTLTLGAPAFITGMLKPGWSRLDALQAMTVEMVGALLIGSGSLAFAIGIIGSGNSGGTLTSLIVLGIGWGHINRSIALYKTEKRARAIEEATRTLEG